MIVKQRNLDNKWMSPVILEAIKEKDLLWARTRRAPNCSELRLQFKHERNRVNAMIRLAKRNHFRSQFEDARFNSKKTWLLVNNLKGASAAIYNDTYFISHFQKDGQSIANDFNKLFSLVSGASGTPPNDCPMPPSVMESAFLPDITESDLRCILFSLKRSKSPGHDGLTVSELCRNFEAIKGVLLVILNSIISRGIIPTSMKTAKVIPLYKGGSRNMMSNYRPISILPCIGQIFEKHLLLTMTNF